MEKKDKPAMSKQEMQMYEEQLNEPYVEDEIMRYMEYNKDIPIIKQEEITFEDYKKMSPEEIVEIVAPDIDDELSSYSPHYDEKKLEMISEKADLSLPELQTLELTRKEKFSILAIQDLKFKKLWVQKSE